MPKAILIAGSTGAGKSTYARKIAADARAMLFSIDEWMKTLFWMDATADGGFEWAVARVRRCEDLIWGQASQALDCGLPVVLDLGFSKREQRDRFKDLVRSRGHDCELHFLDVDVATRRDRVRARNETALGASELAVDDSTFDWMEKYFERPSLDESAYVIT